MFVVFSRGFLDGFEGISWLSYEHLKKCRTIFVVADSVGMFDGESCGYAVLFVAC